MTVEKFRLALAAMGYRAYLLTDDEVWAWAERLVAPLASNYKDAQEIQEALFDRG